jgi:branched-chain amino acid transport system substrate-binding protein
MKRIIDRTAVTKVQVAMLVAIIAVASIAAGALYYYSTIPPSGEIVIGSVLPLTGTMASIGGYCKNGQDLAVADINAAGGIQSLGGAKLKLVEGDLQSDPTLAVTETERIITTYNPVALIGAYASSLALPVSTVTESHKVPYIAAIAQTLNLTNRGYQYVWRQAVNATKSGLLPGQFIADMESRTGTTVETAALVYDNVATFAVQRQGVINTLNQMSISIVVDEQFTTGVSDFTPVVTKIRAANPDILVSLCYTDDAILLARTVSQMGVHLMAYITQGAGYQEPDFAESAGSASDYVFIQMGWARDLNLPGLADVVERYEAKYNVVMNEHAGMSYSSVWILKEVLELSGTLHPDNPLDPDSIRDAFAKIHISSGLGAMTPAGEVAFNTQGDNIYATQVFMQWINGTQFTVWPFKVSAADPVWPRP